MTRKVKILYPHIINTLAAISLLLTRSALAQDSPVTANVPEKIDQSKSADPATPPKKKEDSGYFQLDGAQRRGVLLHRLTGYQMIYETVPGTITDHARNFPDAWGRGFGGLGKRFGSQYGQFAADEVIEFGFAAWRQEDPRYHAKAMGGFGGRLGHSLAATFVTKDANGKQTVAGGRLLGIYGGWAVATVAWLPEEERNLHRFAINSGLNVLTKTGANVFREFWPDAKQKFFTKKAKASTAPDSAPTPKT